LRCIERDGGERHQRELLEPDGDGATLRNASSQGANIQSHFISLQVHYSFSLTNQRTQPGIAVVSTGRTRRNKLRDEWEETLKTQRNRAVQLIRLASRRLAAAR